VTATNAKSPLPIRAATPADYDAIVEVWVAAGLSVRLEGRERREAFLDQLTQFPDLYLVATDGPRIVGVIFGSHDHRKGWINRLAVHPEYRRRGLGLALATACDRAIRSHGIEIVAALIEPRNTASCALAERLGYRADIEVRYYRKLGRPDI
jgi:ribosomal protein S18 acetylase RimI-like enzyme